MNKQSFRRPSRELGTAWFMFPLLAVCATLLTLILISRPASFAEPVQRQPTAAAPAPYVSSDPSVPAASSVFKDGPSYVPGLAVETF